MRRGQTASDRCHELLEELLQRDYPGARVELWRRSGGEYRLDISRWGAHVRWTHGFTVYCWDTMTECARNGLTLCEDLSQRETDQVGVSSRESCCRVAKCPPHGHAEGCCSPGNQGR